MCLSDPVDSHTLSDSIIRKAEISDRINIKSFMDSQDVFHRHFDWLNSIDWLGKQPFFLAERQNKILSAISCPEFPDNIAWLRFFYFQRGSDPAAFFQNFLPYINDFFSLGKHHVQLATLSSQDWFSQILMDNKFFRR